MLKLENLFNKAPPQPHNKTLNLILFICGFENFPIDYLHVRVKEFNYCKLAVTSYPVAVVAEINTLNLMDNSKKYTDIFI